MYSISAYLGTIVVLVLMMIPSVGQLRAQTTEVNLVELRIDGIRPVLPLIEREHFITDGNNNTVWFGSTTQLWSFSVDSLVFTSWPRVNFDDLEVQPGYDKAADRFLFWNFGVGKVYTWNPGDSTVQRIDRSSHHRTQFDHAWFIHPKTSSIYAFGGYGFWESRAYTSRFDHVTKEWQVVVLDPSKPNPSPRNKSMYAYDEKRSAFHIFGGRAARMDARDDLSVDMVGLSDYWVLDIKSSEWLQKPLFGLSDVYDANKTITRVRESNYNAVVDTVGDLVWYPIRSPDPPHSIKLMAFDLERGFGTLTPLTIGDHGVNSQIYWIKIHIPTNRLLLFWLPSDKFDGDQRMRVSAYQLPSSDSTRLLMDLIKEYGSVEASLASSNLGVWLSLILLLFVSAAVVWIRSKRPVGGLIEQADSTLEINICYIGQPRLLINGMERTVELNDSEWALLLWLYWKHRQGEPFQITDQIEEAIWKADPNIDYLRKRRNKTLRGLNEQLKIQLNNELPDHNWILERTSINDKRKREYALNLAGLHVNSDLDGIQFEALNPFELLISHNGFWVEEIRNEIGKMNIPTKNSA